MRRRTLLGLAAGLGAAALTDACGVPSQSNPIRLGDAPTPGVAEFDGQLPPTPDNARDAADLVSLYLQAAAGANTTGGDRPDAHQQAHAQLGAFFTDGPRIGLPSGDKLLVIRAVPGDAVPTKDHWTLDVPCVPLGYLGDYGDIAPVPYSPFQLTFTVVATGGNQWRIDSIHSSPGAPTDLLFMDSYIDKWYEATPTYFWDPDTANLLVPELRYMPTAIANAKRPVELVRWIVAGPSDWLSTLQGQPVAQGIDVKETLWDSAAGRLTLNLSSKASGLSDQLKRNLAIQVWWTLRTGTVELNVEGTPLGIRIDADAAMQSNVAARPENGPPVEKFCIVDHKVRETGIASVELLSNSGNANTDVVLAAMTRQKRNSAFIRQEGAKQRLWVGTVTGGGDTPTVTYVPTAVVGTHFSRPVWIGRPQRMVMVVVDGNLMTVVPAHDAQGVHVGPLPRGLDTITAFAVAPEGRRIALIAGDQVIVAAMTFGDNNTVGIVDPIRTVYSPLASNRAVGWGDEVSLVIGGAPALGKPDSLLRVAVSAAGSPTVAAKSYIIDQVSCFPANAADAASAPLIMVEANGQAYDVFSAELKLLASSIVTPSVGPSTPPSSVRASAPFFLDLI